MPMTWFVVYNDDYPDNGGVGCRSFGNSKAALNYIDDRISSVKSENTILASYTLIEGKIHEIEPAETVVKMQLKV